MIKCSVQKLHEETKNKNSWVRIYLMQIYKQKHTRTAFAKVSASAARVPPSGTLWKCSLNQCVLIFKSQVYHFARELYI